jgi:hypothetical protein
VDEAQERLVAAGFCIVPPVIDEDVQRTEGLDAVPPENRNEDGVSRFEDRLLGRLECLFEHREFREIRLTKIDHADR